MSEITQAQLIMCDECEQEVSLAVDNGRVVATCPCGDAVVANQIDADFPIDPIVPDKWSVFGE